MIDTTNLRNIPLFREFEEAQLQQVAQTAALRTYHKHEFIVREGDPGGQFYIILDGSVAVTRVASDGRETILSILKSNDFFGEMSLFDSSLRSASIKTLSDVKVGVIDEKAFLEVLERSPKIARYLVTALSQRLRAANQLIAATTSQDIRARLASLLLNLSQSFGEKAENGIKISLRLTNQEMANMIGTTRETVNRTLNRFWDEKLIDMRTSHVIVVEPDKLRSLIP
ncbi:MAG: Crp/Fnr family transcriptional regulator [Vulcanimicrobiaceae bacterium]|jgi:CRP/FNR family transcriptional regulator